MATYKHRINPMAISDILAIKAYIAEDNPDAAKQMGITLYTKIEGLADFPGIGISLRTKVNINTDYRFLVCGSYLIFYILGHHHQFMLNSSCKNKRIRGFLLHPTIAKIIYVW